MPIIINPPGIVVPPTPVSSDLVTLEYATTGLAAVLPHNTSFLPDTITNASSQIVAFLKRDIVQKDYTGHFTQIRNSQGFSSIFTRQYPLNWINRLSINPTSVLSISNQNFSVIQRATVQLTVVGDVTGGQLVTGLTLKSVASGVTTTSTIPFSTNITIQAVANAVTALGNGWTAQVGGGYALWPSADFLPNQGVQSAAFGSQAELQQYVTDVTNYSTNGLTGEIRFNAAAFDPVFSMMNVFSPTGQGIFPPGWQNVRVEYNAGYTVVPPAIQMATLLTIKDWMLQLNTQTQYSEERLDEWMGKLSTIFTKGIPQSALDVLNQGGWRSYRNF